MATPIHAPSALRRAGRRAVALALLTLVPACRTWRTEPLPVASAPGRSVPGHVRATLADGSMVELVRARVERDTLRGERRSAGAGGQRGAVAVPVDRVRQLEARRVSVARTAGLVGGVMAAWFLIMSVAEAETYGPGSR